MKRMLTITYKIKSNILRILTTASLAAVFFAPSTYATDNPFDHLNDPQLQWENYKSASRSADLQFPVHRKSKIFYLQVSDQAAVFSEEINATQDSTKTFALSINQTFGPPMAENVMNDLIALERVRLDSLAKSFGGKIVSDLDIDIQNFKGKNFYLNYEKNGKKMGLRSQILYTDSARVEQIMIGPAESMYSYVSNNYFDKIRLNDGIARRAGKTGEGWVEYTDPNQVFTVLVPPRNEKYTPDLPSMKVARNRGVFHLKLVDPVRRFNIYYNAYSYKTPKNLDRYEVIKFIYTHHVKNFAPKVPLDSINFTYKNDTQHETLSTVLIVPPIAEYPYINSVVLRVYFKGDVMALEEIIGPSQYTESAVYKAILDHFKFHPERYKQHIPKKNKS